ncbi:NADH-quinone oxidoreductase subunit NuoN [Azoarcus communis]|uniref:NADH-quinone oxidoreductase subunit N n=1 Tax=Parazoarcus communis SWub3 = DSM 12120 TaxID=1121029 RepID=A0A323V9K0_9RHOO|nr:NADH-quinone oxidoreductase subunit NuoN [Parazoarcus communis]NMG46715.1 NADH-quinone oxidoreductase subunit NuoN [Parazoarcus communis]NMG69049.1 NADH-quinone oxidoreductase subunit NuoN [Parazoarcus communis SWub3 = DSM 12120]PZA16908.1 NADH-quinone oxidoreductase subunit NuoN [Azoarcus communis] [Parazoarcus communis SWub3 = DSM 12120]
MNFVVPDFYPAAAEIFVAVMALVIMLATTFARRIARTLGYALTQITLIAAAFITIFTMDGQVSYTFSNMFISDLMGDFLKLMIYFSMAIALLYGRSYLADRNIDKPEYYLLSVLMTLGMMVMVTSNHMLTMYIGLEMMSLALYALVAFDRDSARSTEAGMKYFVLGALASGLLLYGMSMVYGATGTLEFSGVAQAVYNQSANSSVLLFGLVFLVAGICFKLGVVPFHMWVPDVYQGASTAVTLIIATAPKLAAFAMAVRLLIWGLFEIADQWQTMLMFVAVASIILGNLAAIAQSNIKRMLAYSGISHMGFMLLGLLAGVVEGDRHFALNAYSSAMFYAVSYVIMSLASFGMVILLSRAGFEAERIDDFKGLNKRSPWFAAVMMFVMFSMAGIPFFIGFFAKLSVLQAVVAAGYFWLAAVAVVMSVIGAYYYLRIVKIMYFDEPEDTTPIQAPAELRVMLSANGIAIAALGLAPQMLMSLCAYALLASL